MAMSSIILKEKQKGGKGGLFGGLLGSILGGIAGALAAPVTGGASLAATAGAIGAGMGLGGGLGGKIGQAVDPGKIVGGKGVPNLQRAAGLIPEVGIAKMAEGQQELARLPGVPAAEAQDLISQLEEAKRRERERLGMA